MAHSDPRLDELLARHAAALARGEVLSPEELCRDAPDLLDEVRRRSVSPANVKTIGLSAAAQAPPEAEQESLPDVAIPGFEIMEELGRGGMGVVYLARQIALNRPVALKMILAGSHAGERDKQRFRAEAEAIARIQHPGIVQIYDVGTHAGRLYLVLEFVNGTGLDRQLDERWPAARAAELIAQLCEAVDAAHRCGIVHRDLKPANVLIATVGQPKIADFGLAKQLDGGTAITQTGAVLGTPQYMAPEQANGQSREIGPWTDVFALGAILYQLLTGKPPFVGDSALTLLQQVCAVDPMPLRERQPDVPRDLETIAMQALAKSPAQRYRSAADFGADLRRFLAGAPIQGRRPGPFAGLTRWLTRPERIRDAGTFLIIHGVIRTLAVLPQLGKFLRLALDGALGGDAVVALTWLLGVSLVLFWTGWRALQGHVLAIWGGLAVAVIYLAQRLLDVSRLLESPEQTQQLTLTFAVLFAIQAVMCVIALRAHRAAAGRVLR